MIKVALTNLGKYNEGELVYTWINLPASDEEIKKAFIEIGIDGEEYEEYFISDYEFSGKIQFNIREYANISQLNEIAEQLDELDDEELNAVQAYIDLYGIHCLDDVEEAIGFARYGGYVVMYDCNDMTDVAHYYIDEAGIYDLPEIAKRYFDYEAFGRDLEIDGTFVFLNNGICVEILD